MFNHFLSLKRCGPKLKLINNTFRKFLKSGLHLLMFVLMLKVRDSQDNTHEFIFLRTCICRLPHPQTIHKSGLKLIDYSRQNAAPPPLCRGVIVAHKVWVAQYILPLDIDLTFWPNYISFIIPYIIHHQYFIAYWLKKPCANKVQSSCDHFINKWCNNGSSQAFTFRFDWLVQPKRTIQYKLHSPFLRGDFNSFY